MGGDNRGKIKVIAFLLFHIDVFFFLFPVDEYMNISSPIENRLQFERNVVLRIDLEHDQPIYDKFRGM